MDPILLMISEILHKYGTLVLLLEYPLWRHLLLGANQSTWLNYDLYSVWYEGHSIIAQIWPDTEFPIYIHTYIGVLIYDIADPQLTGEAEIY